MNHSSEISALKEQVAVLTEALADHINPPPPPKPPLPHEALGYGPKRAADGSVVFDPEGAAALREQEKARREAEEASDREYRHGGLSKQAIQQGYHWDDSGILRKQGAIVKDQGNLVRRSDFVKSGAPQDAPPAAQPQSRAETAFDREARMTLEDENAERTRTATERKLPSHDYDPFKN